MLHKLSRIAFTIAGCITAAGCSSKLCCVDDNSIAYGRVYGLVQSTSHGQVQDVFIQAEGSPGVTTDTAGAYALDVTVHGVAGSSARLIVRALRTTPQGVVVDSTRVSAQVPLFAQKPVSDSARVDLTLP